MNHNPPNNGLPQRKSIRLKGYDYAQAGKYFITICCENRTHRFGKITQGEMQLNEYGKVAHNEWIKLPERFPNCALDVFQIMPNHIHGIIVLHPNVGATLAVARPNTPPNDLVPNNDFIANEDIIANNDIDPMNDIFPFNHFIANNDFDPSNGIDPTNDSLERNGQSHGLIGQPHGLIGQPHGLIGQPRGLPLPNIVGAYKSLVAKGCLDLWKLQWAGVNPAPYLGKIWQRNYYERIIRDERSYETISNYIINNPANWDSDSLRGE